LREKDEKRKAFFESDRFMEIYQLIYDYVKVHGGMGDSDFQYGVTIDFITGDEYHEFIDAISHMVEDENEEDAMFATWHNHYRGLSVRYMSGQGTVSDISLNVQGDRNDKLEKLL
jgi:hypothetical protein